MITISYILNYTFLCGEAQSYTFYYSFKYMPSYLQFDILSIEDIY